MTRLRRRAAAQTFRYYVHLRDEWGMGRPLDLIRVRGDGFEEVVEPGPGRRFEIPPEMLVR